MSLLQLKREAVSPTSLTQRQARFQTVVRESYPFGQTGLGARGRPAPGSHVTQFRENRHGWGGEGFPVAVDAGTNVEDGVAAHVAVDRVQGGHQPAAVGVPRVE
jgi:hypothetical protein